MLTLAERFTKLGPKGALRHCQIGDLCDHALLSPQKIRKHPLKNNCLKKDLKIFVKAVQKLYS